LTKVYSTKGNVALGSICAWSHYNQQVHGWVVRASTF